MIYHITTADDWRSAQSSGSYTLSTRGRTLDEVGFIHCSYARQVTGVANMFYTGLHGLVLLVIDPRRVNSPIRDEPVQTGDTNDAFPHIYGPLNPDAVLEVVEFEPAEDGTFELPTQLREGT